jgi:ankyrin repeat protein
MHLAAVENHYYALATIVSHGGKRLGAGAPITKICTLPSTGSTALHTASANGFLDQIRFLIANGHIVDCLTHQNETPLFAACRWGEGVAAGVLLSSGADINARTSNGTTPFHAAISHGFLDLSAFLYAKGARRMCSSQCTKCRLQLKMAAKRMERMRAKSIAHALPTTGAGRSGDPDESLDAWNFPDFMSTLRTVEQEMRAEVNRRQGKPETEGESSTSGNDWVKATTESARTSDGTAALAADGASKPKKKQTKKQNKKKKK